MKIINRYLIREFFKPLFLSSAAFGVLVLISEFFRELSFYMENKTDFATVFGYLFLNLPWWTIQALPVAVLLAVLFSLGGLAQRGEITALKAAGVNLWRVIAVFFACGLLIGAAEIGLREGVIPFAVRKAEVIRKEKIRNERVAPAVEFYNLVVSLPGNGRMTIGYINAASNYIKQVVADYYDESFVLRRQLVARDGTWSGGVWTLNNGVDRVFEGGAMKETYFTQKAVSLPFRPGDFVISRVRPEQMTTAEYRSYIRQLRNLGVPVEKDRIQFHLRWSSAFSHVVVMLIGIPFALGFGSRHGKIISFTFALGFAFIYWGVQAVGQSLGENMVIPPFAAAWAGNFIFGVTGLYLLARIEK